MSNKAFQSILESLAAQIDILNKNGYKLYDSENPEYYISGVKYDKDSDKLFIKFDEETVVEADTAI